MALSNDDDGTGANACSLQLLTGMQTMRAQDKFCCCARCDLTPLRLPRYDNSCCKALSWRPCPVNNTAASEQQMAVGFLERGPIS